VVGIETLEHAQCVLKSLRSRSSASRNYQTMEAANFADGARGLSEFNTIIVDKGKEVARKQEERQKELAVLDLIGNPAGSSNSPVKSIHAVNHTLRSDRYELSPSKLAALAKVGSLEKEGGVYGSAGAAPSGKGSYGTKRMERMAINRPRKTQGINKAFESKHRDSDDDFFSDDDDDYKARPRPDHESLSYGRADTPPKSCDDMPKYDSDDDVEPLTAAERGSDKAGNSAIPKNKAAINQGGNDTSKAKAKKAATTADGFMRMNQSTTSNMTNGVKNQMLSPQSSPDGPQMSASSSRVSIHNPIEATSAESQEFADGLKYMMEASLNEHGPDKYSHGNSSKHSYAGSVAGNIGSGSSTSNSNSSSSSSSSRSSAIMNTSVSMSKTAMAMDIAKNKGAVLKKGGVFVRAGGARKARQAGEANM